MISEHDRQILSQLPAWNPTGDIVAQRRAWEELATVYNHELPAIGGLEQNVELRSGLCADIAVPKGAGRHPVVVYLHGGGWAFGSPASFRKLGMQFAEAGYLTIILDYRLAPEHPFPSALEDAIFALPGLQEQLSTYVSGNKDLWDDPRVSPLKAVAPGVLPPCFILGAGDDSWCLADSLALAQALSAVASPYELHVMEGIPHGFMQMSTLDGCRAAMRLMWEFLARNV
jgi:acetyl esterase/lipase